MSEYAARRAHETKKAFVLDPNDATGELFSVIDAPAASTRSVEHTPASRVDEEDPVETLARDRELYREAMRELGRDEARIKELVGRKFGPRIARLAITHDVTRLLPPEPAITTPVAARPEYRDARSAAANDRLDDY